MNILAVTFIKIAGFTLKVVPKIDISLIIESGYEPFLVEGDNFKEDVLVEAFPGIPKELLDGSELLYTANQDGKMLWQISKLNDSYLFNIFDQENPEITQQVAIVDLEFKHWKIFMEPIIGQNHKIGLCPLLYPMGPLILYTLTVFNKAIMIHASGVQDVSGNGRLFSGFSGVGKSTMAKIWANAGATIINDDRLIIRKSEDGFCIHNTPMYYLDQPKNSKLDAIYLPYHSKENSINKLSGSTALARLMAFCIQHGYNREHLENHLDFLTELCSQVPVYELGVVPDKQIIGFINSHGA